MKIIYKICNPFYSISRETLIPNMINNNYKSS